MNRNAVVALGVLGVAVPIRILWLVLAANHSGYEARACPPALVATVLRGLNAS